jgi:hypothetical protein
VTSKPDPIEILVRHQEAALVRHGTPMDQAHAEAVAIVDGVLEDLARLDLRDVYLSVILRRARVYRMKCQGLKVSVICERLGIGPSQAKLDYRAELLRRRVS